MSVLYAHDTAIMKVVQMICHGLRAGDRLEVIADGKLISTSVETRGVKDE